MSSSRLAASTRPNECFSHAQVMKSQGAMGAGDFLNGSGDLKVCCCMAFLLLGLWRDDSMAQKMTFPLWTALTTAACRVGAPSFLRALARWKLMVAAVQPSISPICREFLPVAASRKH